jgi:adenylate cyclase
MADPAIPALASSAVRRPIGAKIFGITLLLLLLMAAVTWTSTINLKRLNAQLGILSEYDIPLDQLIGEVRANHLSQILQFERLLAQRPTESFATLLQAAAPFTVKLATCDSARLREVSAEVRQSVPAGAARTVAMYEVTRVCSDRQIATAQERVRAALGQPGIAADPGQVQKFTQLAEKLQQIARERTDLHTTITRYLAEAQGAADARALELLKEQIDQNRRTVGRETGALARLLHDYTQAAAAKANALERQAFAFNWAVTLGAAALGLILAALLTRNLLRPVRQLLSGASAIEQGDLDFKVIVNSADELALLARSFNFMVSGLREKESIKATFGKYVDPRIVSNLLQHGAFGQSGEKRVLTVFFSDIEGFTSICEQLTPAAVVQLLNHYFTEMSEPIRAQHGIIDKYIGDAIMAFWGPPFVAESEHARFACEAALDQLARLERFRIAVPDVIGLRRGLPSFNIRIGIATGAVTVGSIGSETTRSYTVIGDTANLAARLEAVNKQYGTRIIISDDTRAQAQDAIEARALDRIRVVGKSESVRVHELLGRKGQVEPARLQLRDAFERGLAAYHARDWAAARAQLDAALRLDAADAPSRVLLARIEHFEQHPPPADWDGVWSMREK